MKISKISYKIGNVVDSDADVLVNTVNCVGVMGKGVALEFKKRFPDNFNQYKEACSKGLVQEGKIFVTEPNELCGPRYIVNLATKNHWRDNSSQAMVVNGLLILAHWIMVHEPKSMAMPNQDAEMED